jgi:hypothetical protein
VGGFRRTSPDSVISWGKLFMAFSWLSGVICIEYLKNISVVVESGHIFEAGFLGVMNDQL